MAIKSPKSSDFVVDSFQKRLHSQQLKGLKKSNKLGKRKGYHLSIQGYEKGIFLVKNGIKKGKGLELGAEPPRIKLVESHPLPRWDCASFLETMLNLLL